MNFLEYITRLALLTRVSEWHDKALSIVVCSLILLYTQPETPGQIGLFAAVTLFSMFLGCYGYSLNSYCELEQDAKAGKYHMFARGTGAEYRAVIALSALGALAVLPFLINRAQVALALVVFVLATFYSARPVRFKERGILGVVVGGITQRPLPFLLVVLGVEANPEVAVFLTAWLTLLGLSTLMAHQLDDFENDRFTGQKTWAQDVGRSKVNYATAITAMACSALPLLAIPIFEMPTGLVVLLTLFLLSCKQMIWIGQIVVKSIRNLRYQDKEAHVLEHSTGKPRLSKDPITAGQEFLIERIQEGEVGSRAPDDCPHKSWEYVGEPYLALNSVIALGNSIPDSVRTSLSTRLLQFQDAGTWDYTNGMRGPDADTSASAIRALDRLGHTVDLAGLYTFKHRDSDLFNTFRIPGENMGLCFLPQSREKHFGVHPCVLPNIWMLLKERGQLIEIDHSILHRIHNKDGSWPSYFYVSPFYSTRLYTELLSTFDSECNKHLEETTDFLLRSEAGSSPVQTAEIAIALHHLRPIVKSRSREIDSRAKQLLKTLKSQQLGDGSWVGENIWTFLHRTHSQPAVGFDSFRVHSTSLCVQALRYWN